MMQDPLRRGQVSAAASSRVEQEKQAADSLRLLSTSLPGTPTMSNNGNAFAFAAWVVFIISGGCGSG